MDAKTISDIYRVEGDTLKYCTPNAGGGPRPKEFASRDGSTFSLWKRVSAPPDFIIEGRTPVVPGVKGDVEAIEKVVRSYRENSAKPSTCEENIGLCLEDAVHSVVWKGEGKVNRATIREQVAFIKKTFPEDHPTTVESVKVEVYGKTGLAVAFVQFHHLGVDCHDVITLTLRDGAWKIVSIVQENLEPK
jgi:hypothetical protein